MTINLLLSVANASLSSTLKGRKSEGKAEERAPQAT